MRLIIAAFAALLAMSSAVAAGPVAPLIIAVGGAWAGTAAASAILGVAMAGTLGYAAIQVGVATVIGMLGAKLLAPKLPTPEGQQVNLAQSVAYQERVYGRARKGGPYGLIHFTRVQFPRWRNVDVYVYTVILAAHQIKGAVDHYLDDRFVTVGEYAGRGKPDYVLSSPYINADGITITVHNGALDQPADELLVREVDGWTAQHDMAGLAYGVITARQHIDNGPRMYPTGRIPTWGPVIDGNDQILDPRTGERGFTRNWALCFAHELVEYQGLDVDWDAIAMEADVCDQMVTTGEGTQRPRWRVGGTISDETDFASVRAAFATAADAYLFERPDGKFGFYAGRWMEPQVSLGPRDFIALQIGMARDMDTANEFTVRYVEPANHWKESPSGAFVHDEDGPRTRKEISAYLVNDHHQACAIAKRAARADHAEYRISGTLNFAGFDLIGHRFVSFQHPEMGVACVLEIQKLVLNADRMTWAFEGVSTAAADWTLLPEEEPDRPEYGRIDGGTTIDVIGSLRVRVSRSTSGSAALVAEWDEQEGNYRQQLRYAVAGSEDWQLVDIPSGTQQHIMTGLLDGSTYEVQIRNIRSGEEGDWSPPVSALAVADADAPPAVTSFNVDPGSGQASLSWIAPNAPNYAAVRIFRGTVTNFDAAILIRTAYGAPNTLDGWTDTGLSAGTYSYWVRPINNSGTPGPLNGPVTVSVL